MIGLIFLENASYGGYIFLGVLVVAIILIVVITTINKKRNEAVEKTSEYLQSIRDLNDKYEFKKVLRSSETKVFYLSSKKTFDNFNYNKRSREYILENISYYEKLSNSLKFNENQLRDYRNELNDLHLSNDEVLAKENKMSLSSYRNRELKLRTKLIQNPTTSYALQIKWEYTSPAGRNHYSNYRNCSLSDIRLILGEHNLLNDNVIKKQSSQGSNSVKQNIKRPSKIYTNDDIEEVE